MNFLENIKNWKIFPNVETLGYFNPLGNFIHLNQYSDKEDFEKSFKNPFLDRNRYSVYVHEFQHYIDHVSTLWGALNIYKIYRAFDAAIMFDEYNFFKLRELTLEFKRNYFLNYYTETYNQIKGDYNNRWKFQITSGLRFDHNGKINEDWPIPFISFATNEGVKISRVPISVVSLLETTATYAEYEFQTGAIARLKTPFRELQLSFISKKLESKLYHPDLTLYSAAVHLTSVNLKINDPILGYKISSIFAKIALNIPTEKFPNITIPEEFNSTKESTRRSKKMLENLDRGFAFYLLIKNYSERFGKLEGTEINIENILNASNLPDEKEMKKLISKEIRKLDNDVMLEGNTFNRMISDKLFFGSKFREQTGIGQQKEKIDISEHFRDRFYLIFNSTYFEYEELELKPIIEKSIKQMDLTREEWFRLYTFCDKQIDTFNEICGI